MAALWILVSSLVPLPFYGAIAYDRQSGAYGFAYDQPSPVAAGRLDKFGSPGCALVLEFVDGCGAYATGPNAAAGAGSKRLDAACGDIHAPAECDGEVREITADGYCTGYLGDMGVPPPHGPMERSRFGAGSGCQGCRGTY